MGQARTARQGDFLALMEPGPPLAPTIRAVLVPLIAALLLEAAEAESRVGMDMKEAGDDQDRA